ncbi:hypothetical protein [Burkholderia pseudomallei]|uniref:hypothetical protein n=1 Tax=Burkholderia pseudomallei TaxID=28450 RepID=UPI0015C2E158|nr:hypothetical protein [Burkholderia pseudomallei]
MKRAARRIACRSGAAVAQAARTSDAAAEAEAEAEAEADAEADADADAEAEAIAVALALAVFDVVDVIDTDTATRRTSGHRAASRRRPARTPPRSPRCRGRPLARRIRP